MNIDDLKKEIETIIKSNIPEGCSLKVWSGRAIGSDYIGIMFGASNQHYDALRQTPQSVSLNLDLSDLELQIQIWGGAGGQSLTRKPNLEDASEKYLACGRIKVPFRKPKNNITAILKCISDFSNRWVQLIKENKSILMYQTETNNYINF